MVEIAEVIALILNNPSAKEESTRVRRLCERYPLTVKWQITASRPAYDIIRVRKCTDKQWIKQCTRLHRKIIKWR